MKLLFEEFENASGQAINYSKSGIFFSSNTSTEQRHLVMQNLGVSQDLNTIRYLGLPSLIGRNKKTVFRYLKSRLLQRIHGWRHKFLSRAGKGVLIQSVGQALPSYVMSSFLLPTSLADELQRMLNSFRWGSKKDVRRSLHWLSWDRLCVGKDDG